MCCQSSGDAGLALEEGAVGVAVDQQHRHTLKVRVKANHELKQVGEGWFGFGVAAGRLLDRRTGRFLRSKTDEMAGRKMEEEEAKCA